MTGLEVRGPLMPREFWPLVSHLQNATLQSSGHVSFEGVWPHFLPPAPLS